MSLRIVFDARSVGPQKSGIGNYADALLRHMLELDDEARFLVLRQPGSERLVESERVEELACPGDTKSMATVFRVGRARNGFAGYDLYHSPCELVPLGLRCPFVVTLHDLMWIEAPALASSFLPVRLANALWYRLNFAHAFRGARAIIAISQATADAMARLYPQHSAKTHVVHHGIELPPDGGSRALLERHVPAGERYSLIVGQGSPYKNHARMIRAFIEATDHKLVLVRRFSRIDFEMHALLGRPEIQRRIIAIPHVDDDVLHALYRHAHMLLFASLYEGFGMPALEAMAVGTPVLGSTAPAVLEVTGDAALHAIADDHSDLVAKIRQLDSDEPLRAKLIAAGHRRVSDFSWHQCARQTLAIYRSASS